MHGCLSMLGRELIEQPSYNLALHSECSFSLIYYALCLKGKRYVYYLALEGGGGAWSKAKTVSVLMDRRLFVYMVREITDARLRVAANQLFRWSLCHQSAANQTISCVPFLFSGSFVFIYYLDTIHIRPVLSPCQASPCQADQRKVSAWVRFPVGVTFCYWTFLVPSWFCRI